MNNAIVMAQSFTNTVTNSSLLKLEEFAKIIIPINYKEGKHWRLCVVDICEKKISLYDSICPLIATAFEIDAEYEAECMYELEVVRDFVRCMLSIPQADIGSWDLIIAVKDRYGNQIPQQNNGSDCGVYMCAFANFLGLDEPLTFSPTNVQQFRRRITADILHYLDK
jgi:Ulp1 family protease